MSSKEKIVFFHGFLGGPQDMEPLFVEGYENRSVDLREILFLDQPIKRLYELISDAQYFVGYSFGGRLLEEVLREYKMEYKKVFFVSSRHTPYPEKELGEREQFKQKLLSLLQSSREEFDDYWKSFALFGGHSMESYRRAYGVQVSSWKNEEVLFYLENHFNSTQCKPFEGKAVCYLFGESDVTYKKEAERLVSYNSVGFFGCGHRLCFEKVGLFKAVLCNLLKK